MQNESLLLSVVARLITDHFVRGHPIGDAGREHAAVTRVKEWLDANFEKHVSIRSLADLAGLSPYYLVRAFHRDVGVPPHRYQTIVRVNRARKLLAVGGRALGRGVPHRVSAIRAISPAASRGRLA